MLTASGTERVPPGDVTHEVAAGLPLFNRKVGEAHASRSGQLRVRFVGGPVIEVPVNESFENWQVVLPDGRLWVGLPGG
jgi:Family of unknown function (DUF6188)